MKATVPAKEILNKNHANMGLTIDLYSVLILFLSNCVKQRFTRPKILFACVHTLSTCFLGFRSFDTMISGVKREDFFQLCTETGRRGHSLTILKQHCRLNVRKYFFTHRVVLVVDTWNKMSEDTD